MIVDSPEAGSHLHPVIIRAERTGFEDRSVLSESREHHFKKNESEAARACYRESKLTPAGINRYCSILILLCKRLHTLLTAINATVWGRKQKVRNTFSKSIDIARPQMRTGKNQRRGEFANPRCSYHSPPLSTTSSLIQFIKRWIRESGTMSSFRKLPKKWPSISDHRRARTTLRWPSAWYEDGRLRMRRRKVSHRF